MEGGSIPAQGCAEPVPGWGVRAGDGALHPDPEAEVELLRAVAAVSPEGILVLDADGVVMLGTAAAEGMFGASPGGLIGVRLDALIPSAAGHVGPGLPGVLGGECEGLGRREDGTLFPVDVRLREAAGGLRARYLAVVRRRSEDEMARRVLSRQHEVVGRVIDRAPVLLVIVDADGRVVHANDRFLDQVRIAPERLAGVSWVERFIPADAAPRIWSLLDEARRGGVARAVECPLRSEDGEPRMVEWCAIGLDDAGGGTGTVLLGLDTTERCALEKQVVHAQRLEVVGQMASGITHDLKNLLAGIGGVTSIAMARAEGNAGALSALARIRDATQRGVEMIHELLAISRDRPVRPVPIDLNERIRGSRLLYRRILGEEVRLTVRLQDTRTQLLADPGQLDRMLLNLVVNAGDAMPGGGRLTIRTQVMDEAGAASLGLGGLAPGRYVVLSVRDNGIGMDERTRARIFQAFYTTKPEGRGTGLGLAMVRATVRQLRGAIHVVSAPGEGTVFFVALRLAGESRGSPAEPLGAPTVAHPGARVLLVEDDELVRMGLVHELEGLGHEVEAYADGKHAQERIERCPESFDVLLTDVRLPDIGGWELSERAHALRPDLPVVFMSTMPYAWLVENGRLPSGIDALEKPFTSQVLARRLEAALAGGVGESAHRGA